ncbi:hypothetical protein Ahy_B08g093313 [Arachis hypogaea]|uniref:Reverse transcriptase zinc-binding domain-containing protein n=1 Tax=Arachis hypogaea TaxID=3818 RepID=A0A444Y5P9_ARAHY|nr:hypothetical protein Ahy_B08g093313 [Arachis hypogaea]
MVLTSFSGSGINESNIMFYRVYDSLRFSNTSPLCPRCKLENETITHYLHRCGPAVAVWNSLFTDRTVARNGSPDFASWWLWVTTSSQGEVNKLARIMAVCWELWKTRNREVFEGKKSTVKEIDEAVSWYR